MEMKTTVKFFSVVDWEEEQNYLREMHRRGWKFVRLTALCFYHFVKCEPEDVIYQLDYNADGVEHKDEYVQLFADCGWEYLQDYMGYSYFRKSASQTEGAEEIFCDDASRLQMFERVGRGADATAARDFPLRDAAGASALHRAGGRFSRCDARRDCGGVYLSLCPFSLPVPESPGPEQIRKTGFLCFFRKSPCQSGANVIQVSSYLYERKKPS